MTWAISPLKNLCLLFFQVSWIRKRDLHILTMGTTVYSNDHRFKVSHPNVSESMRNNNIGEWNLNLKVNEFAVLAGKFKLHKC
jgi:hypothetical protein